tara:strand:- start:8 stop:559 length:552 start_codon:yes stop_codon:yes gene_type:complete
MKAFIVYKTNYDITILIGSYDQILEYVIDPENDVIEHYKCSLMKGSGNIVLLARKNEIDETKDRVYQFQSARSALHHMQKNNDWTWTREDVVWLGPDTTQIFEAVSQPSEDTAAAGLSWQLEQAAMVKKYRAEAPKESQSEFAESLTALDLSKVYKQHDISMIERGLKFFPLHDWITIKSLMV